MEELAFLIAVQRIIGGVEIERDQRYLISNDFNGAEGLDTFDTHSVVTPRGNHSVPTAIPVQTPEKSHHLCARYRIPFKQVSISG
ncbi:hypothetical protein NKH69_34065 [Mesorhizobium sp. M0976]|uniref:hypothetical protein n=1 Tax=Mesorhizobium sp. M0976 TaxID=2957038 RepID=UPI00333567B0